MIKSVSVNRKISSGGVIYCLGTNRNDNSKKDIEVALVAVTPRGEKFSEKAKNKTVWCLPKGLVDKNEAPQITAVREVKEETGLRGEIINKIGEISYWYFLKDKNTKIYKTVHFYLLKYKEGSTDEHDWEVDDARWFPVDEAINKLSYKGEKEILKKAKEMIQKNKYQIPNSKQIPITKIKKV